MKRFTILEMPDIEDATVKSVNRSLIEATRLALSQGYPPEVMAQSLIGTGASLMFDMLGKEAAADWLAGLVTHLRNHPDDGGGFGTEQLKNILENRKRK
jgi:hypothetical protein